MRLCLSAPEQVPKYYGKSYSSDGQMKLFWLSLKHCMQSVNQHIDQSKEHRAVTIKDSRDTNFSGTACSRDTLYPLTGMYDLRLLVIVVLRYFYV